MSDWHDIESAPKDGTQIWAKRVYEGRVVSEGPAVFASLAPDAPMRREADGGLGPPIPANNEEADELRWCTADRMHRFPTPTHWKPAQ